MYTSYYHDHDVRLAGWQDHGAGGPSRCVRALSFYTISGVVIDVPQLYLSYD